MDLIPDDLRTQMLANGLQRVADASFDPPPVVKLFTPDGSATWLLTDIDPNAPDLAFGLADLGFGTPELGFVSLAELRALRGPLRLPVERDLFFWGNKPISAYAREAWMQRRIVA